MKNLVKLPHRVRNCLSTWVEFNQLAAKYKAFNLSQGAPAIQPPKFLLQEMTEVVNSKGFFHQYPPITGHPLLKSALSNYYSPKVKHNLKDQEILVTVGASQALTLTMMGLVCEGEEVLTFEPFYTQYDPESQIAKANLKTIPLQQKLNQQSKKIEWVLDIEKLKASITQKTKLFIFNNPHNPTGKCFSEKEIVEISKVLEDNPHVIVASDQVYEHLTFDGIKHVPFATVGKNWEKTVTIYSGGKLFNSTGWKIGFALGPEWIIQEMAIMHDVFVFCHNSVGQVAMAKALPKCNESYEGSDTYTESVCKKFQNSRNRLLNILRKSPLMDMGAKVMDSQSGYFFMVDISSLKDIVPKKYFTAKFEEDWETSKITAKKFDGEIPLDFAVARWFAVEKGIASIPGSQFYLKGSPHFTDQYIRFAFCKQTEAFDDLEEIMSKF